MENSAFEVIIAPAFFATIAGLVLGTGILLLLWAVEALIRMACEIVRYSRAMARTGHPRRRAHRPLIRGV